MSKKKMKEMTQDIFTEDKIEDMANACADRIDDGVHTTRQCAVLAYKKAFADFIEGAGSVEFPEKAEEYIGDGSCKEAPSQERKSIWHGIDELPAVRGCNIFGLQGGRNGGGGVLYFEYVGEKEFKSHVAQHNIVKWAYKFDLIDA